MELRVKADEGALARRLLLHATGPGKILLAHSPAELVDETIRAGLSKHARNTITEPAVLRRTLADIRRSGFCISRDEMTDGASSVAALVHCVNGQVIAAISVVVPSDGRDLQALVPAVRLAAAGITRGMRPFAP